MEWFLVISMFGTDEVLIKPMQSKMDCVKVQKEFNKKVRKKIKTISDVTCEQGEIMETYEAVNKDEIL